MTHLALFEAAGIPTSQTTFDLHISDPASLLNEVARRYGSTERILMEYIDNALDDAEKLYRENADAYPFEIRIEIIIDSQHRYVTVRDNCRGMRRETLERIVSHVGESPKRGITWVNGQFGFGVHAFRAAAEAIQFRTKHAAGRHLMLRLQRNQHRNIQRPWVAHEPFPSNTGTGTEVIVGPFSEDWFENVTAASIKQEVECHFERLLARPDLSITVREIGARPVRCEPSNYQQIAGEDFNRVIDLEFGGRIHPIEVHLKVAEVEAPGRTARFFARGRRINEVAEIRSFINKSVHRTSVWGHPHLLGYIEVGDLVRPVITRDDFDRGKGRQALYDAILELEDEIKAALNRVNEAHRDTTLNRLEDVLRNVLEKMSREDRLRLRSELTAGDERGRAVDGGGAEGGDEGGSQQEEAKTGDGRKGAGEGLDKGPNPQTPGPQGGQTEGGHQIIDDPALAEGTRRQRSGFDIKFGELPSDIEGTLRRSRLVDGTIWINTAHPDFRQRLTQSRQGQWKFNDRLGAYLAATISIHYKDQFYARYGRQPQRRDQMFDEQVEFICRFEAALRPHLPALQQEFNGELCEEVCDETAI